MLGTMPPLPLGTMPPLPPLAFEGHVRKLKELLLLRADPNQADTSDGTTALLLAAQQGQRSTVQALLDANADINLANFKGTVPLKIAAQQGRSEVVEDLLARDAEVDRRASDGMSSLMMAAKKGHFEIVSSLLNAKAGVTYRSDGGMTALDFCVEGDHAPSVRALLQAGAAVDDAGNTGQDLTALCVAARDAGVQVVRELLGAKASVGYRAASDDGQTPLHYAVLSPSSAAVDIVRTLLDAHGDPSVADDSGRNPVFYCASVQPARAAATHAQATICEMLITALSAKEAALNTHLTCVA